MIEASLNHILTNGWSFVGPGQAKRPWSPCNVEGEKKRKRREFYIYSDVTHTFTHHLCHTPSLTHHLCHTPSFTHHFVTHHLWHTIFDTPSLSHTIFYTPSLSHATFHTPSFTHHFVKHHLAHTICHTPSLSHTIFDTPSLSHAIFHTPSLSPYHLSHTIFDTPHCHTPSFTHHFVTPLCHPPSLPHHLSHTTLSHALFYTQLSHTPSFTHNFVTHTIFLCHTPSFTYNFVAHNFVLLLNPPPPSLSFLPSPSRLQHLVLMIGRSCLVGLSGPSIWYTLFLFMNIFLFVYITCLSNKTMCVVAFSLRFEFVSGIGVCSKYCDSCLVLAGNTFYLLYFTSICTIYTYTIFFYMSVFLFSFAHIHI